MLVVKNKKAILLPLILALCTSYARAQYIDDNILRPSVSLKYQINKKLSVTGTCYLVLDHKMSNYKESILGGEVNYNLTSWMEAGVEFRYHGFNNEIPQKQLRYSFSFDHDLSKKWKIKYRPMIVQEFETLDKKHLEENPIEYSFRNRIKIGYDLGKKVDVYLFTEPYLKLMKDDTRFNKLKSGVGIKYKITAQSKVEARFDFINKKKAKGNENSTRLNLGYTFTLGK